MIIDNISNIENYKGSNVYDALKFLKDTDFLSMELGNYNLDDDNYYFVQEYETKAGKVLCEAHYKYIDIQYIVKGEECIGVCDISKEKTLEKENIEGDFALYKCEALENITLTDGNFAVFYPNDLHRPGMSKTEDKLCRKVVVKIKIK